MNSLGDEYGIGSDGRSYHELEQLPDNQAELMAEFDRRKRV